jgi:hypothetical protein
LVVLIDLEPPAPVLTPNPIGQANYKPVYEDHRVRHMGDE